MQAIEITTPSFDGFRRVERPALPQPGTGRIHVRMMAGSLNFADLAVASGHYPGAAYPNVALSDGAGEVIGVGTNVWQVGMGDHVALHVKPRWIAGSASADRARRL